LERLATLAGHHAALSTVVGLRVIHLARVPGMEGGTPDFEPGVSQPAHAMADGKLLLAYLPKAERQYLYEVDDLVSYTSRTIVNPDVLESELEVIRRQGYAVDMFERFEAVRGVAVPVFDLDGSPLLAMLAIGAIDTDREYETWLVHQMQSLASEMSAQIAILGDMPKASTQFARYNLE
jgi:IclR family pca regulon transcriptional regulator